MEEHMSTSFGKEEWITLFRDIGLSEADMARWHTLFEERHGTAHESFLNWLGLQAEEIHRIRQQSSRK
ncbi:MAG: hypothetical protein HQL56_17415 [Magnetococcales bacterium]|nr:hypothetical protein [Magnetococcales bacterium]